MRHEHPVLGYAGTPDRIGTVDGHLSVVDIKTGSKQQWHSIQLAAYAHFDLQRYLRYRRVVVRLDREGTYALDLYGPVAVADLSVFLSALTLYRYFRRINGNRVD
jgi:hypothetical protein